MLDRVNDCPMGPTGAAADDVHAPHEGVSADENVYSTPQALEEREPQDLTDARLWQPETPAPPQEAELAPLQEAEHADKKSNRTFIRGLELAGVVALLTTCIPAVAANAPEWVKMCAHWWDRPARHAQLSMENLAAAAHGRVSAGMAYYAAVESGADYQAIEDKWEAYAYAKQSYEVASAADADPIRKFVSPSAGASIAFTLKYELASHMDEADGCLYRSKKWIDEQHYPMSKKRQHVLLRRAAVALDRCVHFAGESPSSYPELTAKIDDCVGAIRGELAAAIGATNSLRSGLDKFGERAPIIADTCRSFPKA